MSFLRREGDVGGFYVHGCRPVPWPGPVPPPGPTSLLEGHLLWLLAHSIGNERLDAVSGIGWGSTQQIWSSFGVGALGARGEWGDRLLALMVARRPALLPLLAQPQPAGGHFRTVGLPLVSFPRDAQWTADWLGRAFRLFTAEELLDIQLEHLRLMIHAAPMPIVSIGYSTPIRRAALCVLWGAWLVGADPEPAFYSNPIDASLVTWLRELWGRVEAGESPRRLDDLAALKRLTLEAEELFGVNLPRGKNE